MGAWKWQRAIHHQRARAAAKAQRPMDAIPGRLNETWFRAEKTGVYYGQCSELCGIRHAFMPITVRVVSDEEFATWLTKAKAEFAAAPQKSIVANAPSE